MQPAGLPSMGWGRNKDHICIEGNPKESPIFRFRDLGEESENGLYAIFLVYNTHNCWFHTEK
jgi:hypothetical protein